MPMQTLPSLGPVFIGAGLLFLAVTVRDYLNVEGRMTPARQTFLKVAFVFAGICIGLCALQLVFW
jgi:hypothetical protein